MIRWIAAALVAAALGSPVAPAQAVPLDCEHRSVEHAASHHMSREADSRYHVLHGERPTCGIDDEHHNDTRDTGDDHTDIPRRDHFGFHCTWHGCG